MSTQNISYHVKNKLGKKCPMFTMSKAKEGHDTRALDRERLLRLTEELLTLESCSLFVNTIVSNRKLIQILRELQVWGLNLATTTKKVY